MDGGGRSSEAAAAVDPEGDQPHVDFPVDQNGDFIAPEAMTADNLEVGGDDATVADAAADTDAAPAEAEAGADEATVSLTEAADDAADDAAAPPPTRTMPTVMAATRVTNPQRPQPLQPAPTTTRS